MGTERIGEPQPTAASGCAAWLLVYLFTCITLAGGSFYVAFYVAAAYAVVGPLAYFVFRRRRQRGTSPRTSWLAVLAILLLPLSPYAGVEVLTAALGPELLAAAQRFEGWDARRVPVVSYKVLWAGIGEAQLYLVVPCDEPPHDEHAGYLIRLRRSGRGWSAVDSLDIVWSDCGSAEGNVFPPYFGPREF